MASETYSGIGVELSRFSDLRLTSATLGFLQILILVGVNDLLSYLGLPYLSGDLVLWVLGVSLVVTVASGIALVKVRRTQGGLGSYELEWTRSSNPSVVRLSYVTPNQTKRFGLVVDNIIARRSPLYVSEGGRFRTRVAVEGTESSVTIDFKNESRISLALGFRTEAEMKWFCAQLKPSTTGA